MLTVAHLRPLPLTPVIHQSCHSILHWPSLYLILALLLPHLLPQEPAISSCFVPGPRAVFLPQLPIPILLDE
ncbi:hypothetical protein CC80DRAFT_235078 [Byssothecium circinans]|uniref:Uncharacterized protein n=1 Tax=Byssothecium circinans TaxID=147558 RepID=A0A6A5UBX3_9PLEO|nr:hypothetical protein CC80DRAFT_235078 [Byssothecium circinans]